MPTKTRALAKGVPPRLRSPAKSKKQLRKSNKKRKKNPTGSSDESESSESDDARPKAKVKKHAKRHRTSGVEIESVDEDAEPPRKEVEEILDDDDTEDDEPRNKVSTLKWHRLTILTQS